MLRIGDFARLAQVSVKTLHHYDDIGLLRPVHVDRFTGYRYYAFEQLPRLNRILALKDLGFALDQIAPLLDRPLSSETIRGLLRGKQAELRQHIEAEQARLGRVEARLRLMEQEGVMDEYDVVIKELEPQLVLALHEPGVPAEQVADRCRALREELAALLTLGAMTRHGPWLSVFHDDGGIERVVKLEVGVPVAAGSHVPAGGRAELRELPGAQQLATTVHQGGYEQIERAYSALWQWVVVNGYRMVGPYRELYLREAPDEPVTEIQLPVERDLRLERLRMLVPEIPRETLVTSSERLRQALQFALEEARDFGQPRVGPEHLLLGLARAQESLAEHVLRSQGVTLVALREAVETVSGVGAEPASEPQFGEEVRQALVAAVEERERLGHDYLGTEHVLLALLRDANASAVVALGQIGVDARQVCEQVLAKLSP